jgi:hypothetical protein
MYTWRYTLTYHPYSIKHQIPTLVFELTQHKIKPTIYCTLGKHANHYTPEANSVEIGIRYKMYEKMALWVYHSDEDMTMDMIPI